MIDAANGYTMSGGYMQPQAAAVPAQYAYPPPHPQQQASVGGGMPPQYPGGPPLSKQHPLQQAYQQSLLRSNSAM